MCLTYRRLFFSPGPPTCPFSVFTIKRSHGIILTFQPDIQKGGMDSLETALHLFDPYPTDLAARRSPKFH